MKFSKDHARVARGLAVMLILSGCSGGSGLFGKSDSGTPRDFGLVRDWNLSARDEPKFRAVQGSDLVGADGRCADDAAMPSGALHFQAGPDASRGGTPSQAPASPAATTRGIGLGMTECEVVKAAGQTDRVEISADEGGGRRVVLSYPRGDHADVYQFQNGRLKSIQRTPQMQTAEKPGKSRRNDRKSNSN
jgi:hypothetical protein